MNIKELKRLNPDEEITVLIKNPGTYEEYVDYYIGKNENKYEQLKKQKGDDDLLPTFSVKDFLEYYKGRQLLLSIQRESKILPFKS